MGPLEGVTVIDFTQAYSGPYCTVNLADYGARVIKVERRGIGDQARYWLPYSQNNNSGYFALYNRNKESIAVDLSKEEGQEIIKRLVAHADVVVDNFKTGTLTKMNLGYEELKKINPRIIVASLTGYGQYGPMSHLAAYDNIIEGTCGLMESSGFSDRGPIRNGCSVGDSYTGLTTAFAITTAYYHRLVTGEGQRIDVAMQDSLLAATERAFLEYAVNDRVLPRDGNRLSDMAAPYDVFQCKDGWYSVAVVTEAGWQELCQDIERPELIDDPRFETNLKRCENISVLTDSLAGFFLNRTQEELMSLFRCRHMSAAPVIDAKAAISDPHLLSRDMIVEIDDANIGKYKATGIPIKFEKTPGSIQKGSPLLGEHGEKILKELQYTDEEINKLQENGIL